MELPQIQYDVLAALRDESAAVPIPALAARLGG